jgi:hypothetical protein
MGGDGWGSYFPTHGEKKEYAMDGAPKDFRLQTLHADALNSTRETGR